MCFKSKNPYNRANFIVREEFINNKKWMSPFDLNKMLKKEEVFMALPAKTSQQTIILLGKNWKSFFKGIKGWPNIIKIIAENLICRNIKTKKAGRLSSLIIRKEQ